MFQYAIGRHLALKNHVALVVDTTYFDFISRKNKYFVKRKYDLDIFDINPKKLEPTEMDWLPYYCNRITKRIAHAIKLKCNLYEAIYDYKIIYEKKQFTFTSNILECGKNAYLIGYWQNEKYFKEIEKQIRKDFSFRDIFSEKVRELARDISNSNSICLNIRRGDFVNNPSHGFVGMEYVTKAVDHMRRNVGNQKIYVFSDEIDWCKQNLKFGCPHFFVTHDYAGESFSAYLYLMIKCSHFIIPNSTFGWWGAWLSDNPEKIVVAPKRWLNAPGIDTSDIIPRSWITI